MFIRLILCAFLATAASPGGCSMFDHKKETETEAAKKKKDEKPKEPTIADQSADPSFQGFVGRLRVAAARKDRAELEQMLAPNFGYRWDDPPPGETPFEYWDKNNAWPELEALAATRFVPHESYMVSPPKFASDPAYRGYRLGVRQVNGSWKIAYFVTGEDVLQ